MMSVVGKSTCSGFKTGLYISYHGGNAVRYIKQRGYSMKDGRVSGQFDTKYITVLRIEQFLHSFEDQKVGNFLTSNRSIFVWHSSNVRNCILTSLLPCFNVKVKVKGQRSIFWCAAVDIRGLALPSVVKSNKGHYLSKVIICVSIISGRMRIIAQMQSIST